MRRIFASEIWGVGGYFREGLFLEFTVVWNTIYKLHLVFLLSVCSISILSELLEHN